MKTACGRPPQWTTQIALAAAMLATLPGCTSTKQTTIQSHTEPEATGVLTEERVHLSFDDPETVFQPVFKESRWFAKGELETEREHRQRLDAVGVSGREITFLIPPALCQVLPFPDEGLYVIASRDWLQPGTGLYDANFDPQKVGAMTVSETTLFLGKTTMQNAFGTAVDVTQFKGKRRMVRLDGIGSLPSPPIWKKDPKDYISHFGLPVRTTDPGFRELLKDKKLGLAIRGRIGDIANSRQTADVIKPTISSPISSFHQVTVLPITLDVVWVVETQSMTSIVTWKRK